MLLTILTTLILATGTPPQSDHQWNVPAVVHADAEGVFTIPISLIVGQDYFSFASAFFLPGENVVGGGLVSDGFCVEVQSPGTQMGTDRQGQLLDPTLPGQYHVQYSACSSPSANIIAWCADVEIRPATVPITKASMGMLKAEFARR